MYILKFVLIIKDGSLFEEPGGALPPLFVVVDRRETGTGVGPLVLLDGSLSFFRGGSLVLVVLVGSEGVCGTGVGPSKQRGFGAGETVGATNLRL